MHVRDVQTGLLRVYGLGDDLAGGRIAVIDYRPMPMPSKPEILSGSRVILQTGQEYWAVELGQSVNEKRLLTSEQLPEQLRAEVK